MFRLVLLSAAGSVALAGGVLDRSNLNGYRVVVGVAPGECEHETPDGQQALLTM
jgi:hypothetical protein